MSTPDLSTLLTQIRIRGERTQSEMAQVLMDHLPPRDNPLLKQHVYNWENGRARPPTAVINAYAVVAPERAEDLIRAAGLSSAVDRSQPDHWIKVIRNASQGNRAKADEAARILRRNLGHDFEPLMEAIERLQSLGELSEDL